MPEFEPLIEVDGEALSDMIESGPVRRWPGFMLTAVTLGAGVLLAVGAPEPRPVPGPAPRLSPTVPGVRAAPISISDPPVVLDLPGEVTAVDIGPTGYTAAIVAVDCPPPNPCASALVVSEDRLRWQRRQLPDGVLRHGDPVPLVFDGGVLLVESRSGRWHSRDGGRTWRRVRTTSAREVASASAGRLAIDAPGGWLPTGFACFGVLSVIHRDTGRHAPLRQQPTLMPCHATPFPDAAGRLWVGGVEPVSHVPAVAMSPDRGRNWQVWRLTGLKGRVASVRVHQVGSEVYAIATGEPRTPGFAMFRYGSDGWTLVRHATGSEPEGLDVRAVCPGGVLLGGWPRRGQRPGQEDRLLFSLDNGRGWYLARGMSGLRVLTVSYFGRSAWLGWYGRTPGRPVFSEDCRRWEGLSVR